MASSKSTRPKSARSAAVKPKTPVAKPKAKAKAKAASPKPTKANGSSPTAATKMADVAAKARKAAAPELKRLKKASTKVEARLKAVSFTVAAKLAAFEDLAEQQIKSEKTKARLGKLEKDVGRLISSADEQFSKVRGALDEELKDLKATLDRSAEKVIPAAKERIRGLMPQDGSAADDVWEFYTDKSGKWRWRLKDSAGKSVGASNKAFASRTDCIANAKRLGYSGS